MDLSKVGQLIYDLRREKGLTQKQLADQMGLSDKTISKWERGLGCPDVSLLADLSRIFGVHIEQILKGDLAPKDPDGGNMKRIQFFVCPQCGNTLTATTTADIFCCGRRLQALEPKEADQAHQPQLEEVDDEYFLTFDHPMTKAHYLGFAAWVSYDRVTLVKLYPEQAPDVRLPAQRRGELYVYCQAHGLMKWSK